MEPVMPPGRVGNCFFWAFGPPLPTRPRLQSRDFRRLRLSRPPRILLDDGSRRSLLPSSGCQGPPSVFSVPSVVVSPRFPALAQWGFPASRGRNGDPWGNHGDPKSPSQVVDPQFIDSCFDPHGEIFTAIPIFPSDGLFDQARPVLSQRAAKEQFLACARDCCYC